MRILFCCLLMGQVLLLHAQELPDYRSKKDNFAKITDKAIRGDLAAFTLAGIDESTGKQPLQSIPVTAYTDHSVTLADETIQVTVASAPFEPAKHKLGKYENYVIKIDNRPYFGNYGKMPVTQIQSVSVVLNGDSIAIPPAAYADLYNPVFTYTEGGVVKSHNAIYFSADKHRIYIYLLRRDNGDNYEVTWVLQDKKYLRRIVDTAF